MARNAFRAACLSAGLALGLLGSLACSGEPEGPSRQAVAFEDLATLRSAIQAWAADHGGELPETLNPLIRPLPDGRHYLKAGTVALHDPWGAPYEYLLGEGEDGFRVVTRGRDGEVGGSGENADLDQHSVPE